MCHMSHVMCHMSQVTCNIKKIYLKILGAETSLGRVYWSSFKCLNSIKVSDSGTSCVEKLIQEVDLTKKPKSAPFCAQEKYGVSRSVGILDQIILQQS